MNELQRQAYLAALGVENYMPRWLLPFAPIAYQCDVSGLVVDGNLAPSDNRIDNSSPLAPFKIAASIDVPTPEFLRVDLTPSVKPTKLSAASILQQLEQRNPVVEIQPFSLSVWRPAPGFLIVDSRQAALALPTEVFLKNILRALLNRPVDSLSEEVLRWPLVENRFLLPTENHARTELQTWLTVEHELRPITQFWLMGHNAAYYLLSNDKKPAECLWRHHQLHESGLQGLILPSLTEFLQQPQWKAKLWAALQQS